MVRDFSNGVVALSLLAVLTVAGSSAPSALRLADGGFRAFLPRFEAGLHRFVNGDPGPWNEHVSRSVNGSILGGFGGFEAGGQVDARYAWAASQFEPSGATVQVEYCPRWSRVTSPTRCPSSAARSGSAAGRRRSRWRCESRTPSGARTASGSCCTVTPMRT
jgi:hypothetical protein